MDSFQIHNIKLEKANAKLRYRRLQKITAMFRLMEFCIFLIIISKFTTQLPSAFKLSGEYFRGFSVTSVSPRFVFILGNAIVIILFLKSGHLSTKDGVGDTTNNSCKDDLYDEYMKNCEKYRSVYKKESFTTEENQMKQSNTKSVNGIEVVKSDAYNCCSKERKVNMQRSQSENLKRAVKEEEEAAAGRELRRSVTAKCRGCVDNIEKTSAVRSFKEDEMSSEEFRRTVEAFIARQQRALREEE
ncbi:hypothetical protein ACH5RR_022050 [Cinchona calisaya]|uniref:DUF4408 domain-containing protein n=1 Tax=Cinchona calisaya TaxID=153742 RepID=A0ABD2YVA4_9GENT